MEFRPIKPKKIYEEIVDQIKKMMAEGDLNPGDRLLSEREFAEKLQVSRASVREALSALEMMGFVEIRTGEGTFVKQACVDDIIQPLAMFISIDRGSFSEIFEMRKIIEAAAAGLAAERATEEEVKKIEEALKKMVAAIQDTEQGEYSDTAFHYAIAEGTHNNWLIRLMLTISDSFHRTVTAARRRLFLKPGNVEKLANQHKKIYEAIRDRKPELAKQAMLEHLSFAELEMSRKFTE